MAVGSGRTQVSPHPGPLTLLAGFSVVGAISTLLATTSLRGPQPPVPACVSPFPPLLSPVPTPCTFSGASVAPEMKDYDCTLLASVQEESGALPAQGRLRGLF